MDHNSRPVQICIDEVQMVYPQRGGGALNVIDKLTLEIHEHEFLTIVGESGCGKSTLLNIIAGLLNPTQGRVLVKDHPVTGPGLDRTMVFQDDAVFPWYTVRQNVEYGLKIAGLDKASRNDRVNQYLNLTGLTNAEHSFPRELSGGMRKRVDVARAAITAPQVLLMDEPFAALDAMTKEAIQLAFLDVWQTAHMTVLFVTHDIEEALFLSDRVVVMARNPGRVRRIVDVPFTRPRQTELKTEPGFQRLRRELTHELHAKD